MKKIFIKLKENEFQKSKLVEIFENMIFVKKAKYWEIEIFTKSIRSHQEKSTGDSFTIVLRNSCAQKRSKTWFSIVVLKTPIF